MSWLCNQWIGLPSWAAAGQWIGWLAMTTASCKIWRRHSLDRDRGDTRTHILHFKELAAALTFLGEPRRIKTFALLTCDECTNRLWLWTLQAKQVKGTFWFVLLWFPSTKMVEKKLVSTILDTDLCQAFRSMNIPVIWNVLKRCRPKICSDIWLASELRALKVD